MILAIDPGNRESAYVLMDKNLRPLASGKIDNGDMLEVVQRMEYSELVIEMIASYGMAVGQEVFETVFWIGVFWQAARCEKKTKVYRKDVKMNLCHSMKAKDGNVRQALIDRFGVVGTKKNPGWFYGFAADIWSAYAVGVTYYDMKARGEV